MKYLLMLALASVCWGQSKPNLRIEPQSDTPRCHTGARWITMKERANTSIGLLYPYEYCWSEIEGWGTQIPIYLIKPSGPDFACFDIHHKPRPCTFSQPPTTIGTDISCPSWKDCAVTARPNDEYTAYSPERMAAMRKRLLNMIEELAKLLEDLER